MSLIIPSPSERRRNLAFAFIFLPSCLAFAIYEALYAQWSLALAGLAFWIGLLLFSVSHLAQAAVALIIAVGGLATHQWLLALIALFAVIYLLFTTIALRRVPPKEVSQRLALLPWLFRPQPILANIPDWKVAFIASIVGLVVLAAGLALLKFARS